MKGKTSKKRLWAIGAACFLLAGAAVLLCVRWKAWFGQDPELPYTAAVQPARILLTFGDSTELSRNVSWECGSEVRPSFLELVEEDDSVLASRRLAAEGEVFRSRSGQAAYYRVKLRGLRPGAAYRYRVVSGADSSQWHNFAVRDTSRRDFRFLYVGDVQDTVGGMSKQIFRHIFERYPDLELMVSGGDFTQRPTYHHWERSLGSLDSICQSVPFLAVTGNHDYLKGLTMKLERRFSLIYSYFLDSMTDDGAQVYNLRIGDAEFFLLDSTPGLSSLYGQRQWLDSKLEASRAKWKIVVVHHPLWSSKGTMNNLAVRMMFDEVIRRHGVDLVLQGHEHNYARMTARQEEGGAERAVIPVYIVTHCSPKRYRVKSDIGGFDKLGMDGRFYQIIGLEGDTLTLATYSTDDDMLCDSVRIVKGAGATLVESF